MQAANCALGGGTLLEPQAMCCEEALTFCLTKGKKPCGTGWSGVDSHLGTLPEPMDNKKAPDQKSRVDQESRARHMKNGHRL